MTCAACQHVIANNNDDQHGFCRRYPPTVINPTQSQFPIVNLKTFTCGEFARVKRTANPTPSKPGIKEKK